MEVGWQVWVGEGVGVGDLSGGREGVVVDEGGVAGKGWEGGGRLMGKRTIWVMSFEEKRYMWVRDARHANSG